MQKDMHFYGIYFLARATGINPEAARVIAYSSQFIDDAIEDEAIVLPNKHAVLPTMTSHKPIDYQNTIPGDQWKVWVPFHFLPGNQADDGTFYKRMICRKNSEPAQEMVKNALRYKFEPWGPHLIGISAHVYADTFAHYGFSGLAGRWNRVNNETIEPHPSSKSTIDYLKTKFEHFKSHLAGTLAETVPVGHGAVATYPDRPYLEWEYEYEDEFWKNDEKLVRRNNSDDFLNACSSLFDMLNEFIKENPRHGNPKGGAGWIEIEDEVIEIIISEGSMDERIDRWKSAAVTDQLFEATDADRQISYDPKLWSPSAIGRFYTTHSPEDKCDPALFYKAAWIHRHYILRELLPKMGILGNY